MKIGLFSDTYFPKTNGVATSVLMLKENLEANGHEVYVFTTTDPEMTGPEYNVTRIPSIPFKKQRLGVVISPALLRYVKSLSLDIIHTHTEFTLGCLGRIMAKRLRIPAVHTMHTIYEYYTGYIIRAELFDPVFRTTIRKLTAVFCNGADTVIVPSGKTEALIKEYGVRKDIRVIPTGIPLDRFAAQNYDPNKTVTIRSDLGIEEFNKILLSIGRVSHEKNLDMLLISLKEYLTSNPLVRILIVGDGPARKDLEKLAKDLQIHEQIIFAGSRPWTDIHLYYRLGDVFIGASESETQGLTYIEAMASGCPVVAKEDRCLDDLLINGENGYFFNDAQRLSSAIEQLLGDDEMLQRFAQKASESAQKFSANTYAGSVSEVYTALVASKESA